MSRDDRERWFITMYEAEADALFRFCYFKLRDREAAVEIVQETMLRVWDYVSRGQEIAHSRAFVFRVARNAIADYARKSRPLYERELSEAVLEVLEPAAESDTEILAELSGVMQCLSRLPERDQELVFLRHVEGMPVVDIAKDLGEKPNTVTVRLKRALESLRECMGVTEKQKS